MKIKERILLAVITHVVLFGNGCIAQKIAKGTNTSFKFDFGSGKTALGYTAVSAASIYSDEAGFGFEKGATVTDVKRSGKDALSDAFVTSTKPFYFSVKVPEGNYNVKITLGDKEGTSDAAIRAECRRMITDVGALASKNNNNAAVMVWNYHDEDKQGSVCNVKITISGIPSKKITLTQYRIDNEHSNSYEVWKKMGSPQNPTKAQIKELEKAGLLQTTGKPEKINVTGETGQINILLPRQGVSLLKMNW